MRWIEPEALRFICFERAGKGNHIARMHDCCPHRLSFSRECKPPVKLRARYPFLSRYLFWRGSHPKLWRDRHLKHPVALVGEKVIGRLNIVQLEAMRDHRAEVHPPGLDHRHEPPHALFAARTESGNDSKRWLSELAGEAFCNQEYTGGLEQRLDDEAEPVIAQREAPVLQDPGEAVLDRPALFAHSPPSEPNSGPVSNR